MAFSELQSPIALRIIQVDGDLTFKDFTDFSHLVKCKVGYTAIEILIPEYSFKENLFSNAFW